MNREVRAIGHITTPYTELHQCPKNIVHDGPECRLHFDEEYRKGIKGLIKGDSILILYWFDISEEKRAMLIQKRFGSGEESGVFALRSPFRPNPVGVSILPIEEITDSTITVKGLDCLSGTKLIDVKPAI